jgi:hypothetical protein
LSDTSTTRFLDANAINTLYDYEASLPAVWISPFLQVRSAIEKTSGRSSSPAQTVSLLLKLVQQPSAILFFPFRTRWKGLALAKVLVWITTLLGEVCMDLLVPIWLSSVLLFVFLLLGFSDSDAVGGEGLALMFVILFCSVILLRILGWRQSKTNAASYSTLPWRIAIGLIRGVFRIVRVESFAEYTGRKLASLRRMTAKRSLDFSRLIAETLLALALVCAILVGATAFLARESVQNGAPASGPCDVVSNQVEAIRAFAKSTPRGDAEIARIRQELRQRLAEVERANHGKDCGWEVKGEWVVAQNAVADELAARDPRLVPLPSEGETQQNVLPDTLKMRKIFAHSTEPKSLLFAMFHLRTLDRDLSALDNFRLDVLRARRQGFGIPNSPEYSLAPFFPTAETARVSGHDVEATNVLLSDLDEVINRARSTLIGAERAWMYGAVTLLATGLFILIWSKTIQDFKDTALLTTVESTNDIRSLGSTLLEASNSERVREASLSRIDTIGVANQDELSWLENIVGELLRRSSVTDRGLGVKAAHVARILSNRLRHRTTDPDRKRASHE